MGLRKDQNRVAVETDSGSEGGKLWREVIAWLTLANPCIAEIDADLGQALNKACFITSGGVTPNDPKLSDSGPETRL